MINLTLVSPSSVGAYAVCSQKLVYDSTIGLPFGSSEYADFGTLCHYHTGFKLGLNPKKIPKDEVFKSARRLPEFYGQTEDVLIEAIDKCADRAIMALPPLPKDAFWIAEHETSDKNLLPQKKNRTSGLVTGFGGEIDLLRSDREVLVDFKFVSKLPNKLKIEYLWQMGGYHLITGVPKTILLFVTRDARYSAHMELNWSYPKMAELAKQMYKTIHKMGLEGYEQYAVPFAGDQCGFCQHKSICPAQSLPAVNHHMKIDKKAVTVDYSAMTKLQMMAAASKPML